MEDYDELNENITPQKDLSDENDSREEILEILLNTREQGQMIAQLIKNQIEVKDEMISKLHKELDYYKQDAADKFVVQLMKAVIKVRKDMNKLMNSREWEEMSADDLRREYRYAMEDVTDLLEQQNVDSIASVPGDEFNPSIHQPKIEVTTDIYLDKKVKESISEGYKKGDKILIPERVIVYQYKG